MELHHNLINHETDVYEWGEVGIKPFDELILSWNAFRPLSGYYLFSISLFIDGWTPFVSYALWGANTQHSFNTENEWIKSFQDIVNIKKSPASGFKILVEAQEGAKLDSFFSLYSCTSHQNERSTPLKRVSAENAHSSIPLPPLSQMQLNHPRHRSFCSPTSTTSVLRYISKREIDPLHFAAHVYDHGFDIYGNWVFNTAQAFVELGKEWRCWVTRLQGIDEMIQHLQSGFPLVISIKGSLPGASLTYDSGHLMAVRGYDPIHQQFLCMDPAYPSDKETQIAYSIDDIERVWHKRGYLSYLFKERSS